MATAFGNDSVHEHDDLRVVWNGVVPMGGKDDELRVSPLRQELEDGALSLRVQTGDRLVQDDFPPAPLPGWVREMAPPRRNCSRPPPEPERAPGSAGSGCTNRSGRPA
jgi:hypothetical protein